MIGAGRSVSILKMSDQTVWKRRAEGVAVGAGGLLQGVLRSTDLGVGGGQIFQAGNSVVF